MNYAAIKPADVANGPGVRVSLFVSGCTHYCKECFNSEAWDFSYGKVYTDQTTVDILSLLEPSYIAGLSLLGGEPLHPENQKGILPLVKAVRQRFPEKSVWCYTGYDFETEIMGDMANRYPETIEILGCINVLVDGKFELDKKDLNLRFKGSSNQRIIRIPETLACKKIILWQ